MDWKSEMKEEKRTDLDQLKDERREVHWNQDKEHKEMKNERKTEWKVKNFIFVCLQLKKRNAFLRRWAQTITGNSLIVWWDSIAQGNVHNSNRIIPGSNFLTAGRRTQNIFAVPVVLKLFSVRVLKTMFFRKNHWPINILLSLKCPMAKWLKCVSYII